VWRNNSGLAYNVNGRPVRYGLANESARINQVLKSADFIGIRPIIITQKDVGKTIGQFIALEIKNSEWKYTGTPKERAQKAFLDLVNAMGGYAKFIKDEKNI